MVRLRFETDLSTSLQASQDFAKAVDKIGDAATSSVREMNALEKAAKRLVDQNLTPQEKYNQKLEFMARAVKAGKMSMEDAERTAGRLRTKFDDLSKSGLRAFGNQAVSDLASYALGFVGISSAIGAVSTALQQMSTDSQQAANRVFGTIGAFGELQQVATSDKDFLKLAGQARGLRGVFGPDNQAQAADFVFALRNAVYSDSEVAYITKIGMSKQVKPESMTTLAEGLKKSQDVFGKKEAGSLEQVANKIFVAANVMQTNFAQAALATTEFGSQSKELGFSDEESIAAFTAVEKQTKNTEEAGTRMRSFLTQVSAKKLSKGTFAETIKSLSARMARGESAHDIVGETRATAALNILAGVEGQQVFNEMVPALTAANTQDVIGSRRFINKDPLLSAAIARQQEEAESAGHSEDLDAERQNLGAAVLSARRRRARDKLGKLGAFLDILGSNTSGKLTTNQQLIEGEAFGGFQNVTPETRATIENYLRRIAENTDGSLQAPKPSGRQEP